MTPLAGRAVLVTGCTSGIGLALVQLLAEAGAFVIGVGRNAERCEAARTRLREHSPQGVGEVIQADLSTLGDMRRAADLTLGVLAVQGKPALDALVNNAGTFSSWHVTTAEGFELQFAVNQLAPFVLTHLLMEVLRQSTAGSVVTVGSGSHHGVSLCWDDLQLSRHYSGLRAYRSTKLMNVLFTLELSRRLDASPRRSPLRVYAADPGLVATDMGFKRSDWLACAVWLWRKRQGRSPEDAARGIGRLLLERPSPEPGPYWSDGEPAQASRQALDRASASRLWRELERMSGLSSSDYGL